jgi:hypothetical protein
LTVADVDGNGKLDIVAALNNNTVIALTGAGNGNFTVHAAKGLNAGCDAAPAAGKLGTDTSVDVVMPCPLLSQVAVLRGNGTGTFSAPVYHSTGLSAFSRSYVALADFTGDGKLDAIVSAQSTSSVALLVGTSTATFQAPVTTAVPGVGGSVIAADFNADGKQDVAVSIPTGVTILRNTGTGSFTISGTYSFAGGGLLSTADMDGDGWLDVLSTTTGAFTIIHSVGSGSAVAIIPYFATANDAFIGTADFNHDGYLDLVTTTFTSVNTSGNFYIVHLASGCLP